MKGLNRIFRPAIRAGYRAKRLGARWDTISPEVRIQVLTDIERDLRDAHTVARSCLIVARHEAARRQK